MKSLLLLWSKLAEESASGIGTRATMDCKTVQDRCEHEGISFLTITLPRFGKDFQKSLDQGRVARSSFAGFQRKKGLPIFLSGFLEHVFTRDGGRLVDEPSVDAILAIRQLTLLFGKVRLAPTSRRERDAMQQFINCEKDVREGDAKRKPADLADFQRVSSMLFASSFSFMDKLIHDMEVMPKHGPGATADKLMGNQKFKQREWTVRLERIFPAGEFLLPNWRYYDQLDEVNILEPGQERPVRVVSVPKTLKTPRIIGIEPTAMQYAQQAVLSVVRDGIDRDYNLSTIIGIDDQTPNQEFARQGSLSGELATLDLEEASDRVSNQLVREMLRHWPYLHEAVDATRSRKADVPGHGVIRLAKFATMGSALCFPFEAMVFMTLIFLGIERDLNRPLTPKDITSYRDRVRVFGDDIIVPSRHVPSVVAYLEHFGAKVNRSKSFWTGRFRESCGKEYFNGSDISIVRVREVFPARRQDATGVISVVSLRNQLYFAGYWQTCRWLDGGISRIIKHYPVVLPSSPVQGRHSFLGYEVQAEDRRYHRPLVKGYVVDARIPKNSLDGSGALLKWLLKQPREGLVVSLSSQGRKVPRFDGQPFVDEDHLERSGRPQAVNLKLRWSTPY